MNSFLKELEKNYSLFNVTYGLVIELFHFPKDINKTFEFLLAKSNNKYYKNCEEMDKNIHELGQISVKKDESGNCYLQVVGNDNHTILVIRKDDSKYEDYKNVIGTKITEEEFKKTLDYIQKKNLACSNVSSRFIREEPLPIDICKEMNIPLLISYYQYINNYNKSKVVYNEPENKLGPIVKIPNPTNPRRNPVIPWDLRQRELLKRNPKKIIEFEGKKTGATSEAYIYERDGYTLVVVEPVSGMEYQYNLNLGEVDKNNEALIEEIIKEAMEAKEEIVLMDDAIMRKNHTNIKTFSENLDIFLDSAKTSTKFYYDVKNSNSVYRR